MLWIRLLPLLAQLRPLFPRKITFFVFVTAIAGLLTRPDLRGVTSIVRALSLKPAFYKSLLRLFHCVSIDAGRLSDAWTRIVFSIFGNALVRVDGRVIIVADGLKVPKEGKRMPGVKSLHQESSNNSKPEWIMGHMFQSIAVVVEGIGRLFAVPLSSRIHEGLQVSNREQKTLVDKLGLEALWLPIPKPFILVADAYYCAGDLARLLMSHGGHLVSVARSNAVAFRAPDNSGKRRGRKRKYGEKVLLKEFYAKPLNRATVKAYGNNATEVEYWSEELIWKSCGTVARFVATVFPGGKRAILMCTDVSLSPETIIEIYATRMRIEQTFKVLVRGLGAYGYHFWTKAMTKIRRCSKGNFIHREPEPVRRKMCETLAACELFVTCGLIAQGLLQYLAVCYPAEVAQAAVSWYRSQVSGVSPTEEIVQDALRQALPQLPQACARIPGYAKFLRARRERQPIFAARTRTPCAA
jgi:DDE superfamily endonuclease